MGRGCVARRGGPAWQGKVQQMWVPRGAAGAGQGRAGRCKWRAEGGSASAVAGQDGGLVGADVVAMQGERGGRCDCWARKRAIMGVRGCVGGCSRCGGYGTRKLQRSGYLEKQKITAGISGYN